MTRHDIADVLTGLGVQPEIAKGQIVQLTSDEGDLSFDQLAKRFGFLVCEGWLEEHPEGSDRGGYVPTLFFGQSSDELYQGISVYHDENGDGWR